MMMDRIGTLVLLTFLLAACAAVPQYHAPFADLDQDRDGIVEWREFQGHYPEADPKAFLEADRNKDGDISPEEWRFHLENGTP